MREIVVSKEDKGQRFDKYLFKYLRDAPSSFIYKMLRKKNIVLNGHKSDGKEYINEGDVIKLFLSEDTIDKFSNGNKAEATCISDDYYKKMPPVIYEDSNIILVNKPVGMLSQKDTKDSVSVNEICISYLVNKGEINDDTLKTFVPSVCNRLDRNTSGILIFAKNYTAAREMARMLKDRSVHKYYKCIVNGLIDKEIVLSGLLTKDTVTNIVQIDKNVSDMDSNIYTKITPIKGNDKLTLLEVLLITGKTHQIRAHMASIEHPLIGDYKYGDVRINDVYKKNCSVSSQLLCSYKLVFPKMTGELEYLSNKEFVIDTPKEFERVLKYGNLEIQRP